MNIICTRCHIQGRLEGEIAEMVCPLCACPEVIPLDSPRGKRLAVEYLPQPIYAVQSSSDRLCQRCVTIAPPSRYHSAAGLIGWAIIALSLAGGAFAAMGIEHGGTLIGGAVAGPGLLFGALAVAFAPEDRWTCGYCGAPDIIPPTSEGAKRLLKR